jgi:hypothetical protein
MSSLLMTTSPLLLSLLQDGVDQYTSTFRSLCSFSSLSMWYIWYPVLVYGLKSSYCLSVFWMPFCLFHKPTTHHLYSCWFRECSSYCCAIALGQHDHGYTGCTGVGQRIRPQTMKWWRSPVGRKGKFINNVTWRKHPGTGLLAVPWKLEHPIYIGSDWKN